MIIQENYIVIWPYSTYMAVYSVISQIASLKIRTFLASLPCLMSSAHWTRFHLCGSFTFLLLSFNMRIHCQMIHLLHITR
jgi:hypothetical protein